MNTLDQVVRNIIAHKKTALCQPTEPSSWNKSTKRWVEFRSYLGRLDATHDLHTTSAVFCQAGLNHSESLDLEEEGGEAAGGPAMQVHIALIKGGSTERRDATAAHCSIEILTRPISASS